MGSRILYGMAQQRLLPAWLGAVHPSRRTPHYAILAMYVVVLALSLSGSLTFLAGTTSVLLLSVFVLVNLALILIKRQPATDWRGFHVPTIIPVLGAAASLGLIAFVPRSAFLAAGVIVGLGLVIIVLPRRASR